LFYSLCFINHPIYIPMSCGIRSHAPRSQAETRPLDHAAFLFSLSHVGVIGTQS
jgi:hypothetical protein